MLTKLFAITLLLMLLPAYVHSDTHLATACTQAAVQTAITDSASGDTVLIPNGSFTATSAFTIGSKNIIIQAENYTPTSGGSDTRNVTITNNSSGRIFTFSTGDTYYCGVGGIKFLAGTQITNYVRATGSGSKPVLIYDCYFEVTSPGSGTSYDLATIAMLGVGGVIWNCLWSGDGNEYVDWGRAEGASFVIESARAWNTASTLGDLDVDGNINVYVEDSTGEFVGQFPDIDDNGRFVARYNTFDCSGGLTHGFTSTWGGRLFEFYNNTFTMSRSSCNLGRYFWAREGHGQIFGNSCGCQNKGFGTPIMLDTTCESCSSYPEARQVGWGHNGSNAVIDPIYIWNQTGPDTPTCEDDWSTDSGTYIQEGREIYTNPSSGTSLPGTCSARSGYWKTDEGGNWDTTHGGSNDGTLYVCTATNTWTDYYTPYTYPHPSRQEVEGGGTTTTATITGVSVTGVQIQ